MPSQEWIVQLRDGRFILAAYVGCAGEHYAVGVGTEDQPVTGTIEMLGADERVPKYATWEDADDALCAWADALAGA